MILHLVRHPKPVIAPGVCYGQLDVAAKDVEATAHCLLRDLPPGLPVWSSPLRRCRDLAKCLHDQPLIDQRLAEISFGDWEGLSWDDIPRAELDAWAADVFDYTPPGGESPRQLQARLLDFIAGLTVQEAVIVTHAGVIRMLTSGGSANLLAIPSPPYGSVTRVCYENGRVQIVQQA